MQRLKERCDGKKCYPCWQAKQGRIQMQYTHFERKSAAVSSVKLDGLRGHVSYRGQTEIPDESVDVDLYLQAIVPVMSLCPCSKEISEYGAHNQRSRFTILVKLDSSANLNIEERAIAYCRN